MDDFEPAVDFKAVSPTILVGSGMQEVSTGSLVARRALRHVARGNAETLLKSNSRVRLQQLPAIMLQRLLVHTLLCLITLPMEGVHSTSDLRALLEDAPKEPRDSMKFWKMMQKDFMRRGGPVALQFARIQSLEGAQRWMTLELLNSLLLQFEDAINSKRCLPSLTPGFAVPGIPAGPDTIGPLKGKTLKRALVRTPMPWRDSDPPLVMGTNGAWFGRDSVHPSKIVNIQILGGTGSGKTASCVRPALGALLTYEIEGLKASILVIDPKRELEAKVRAVLSQRGELDRLVVIGECPPISFFALDCPLSPTDRMAKCEAFGPLISPDGDGTFWHQLGMTLLRDLLQLQSDYARKTRGMRLFEVMADQLGAKLCPDAGTWGQIREILSWARRGGMANLKRASDVLERLTALAGVDGGGVHALKNYTKDDELFRQFTYACQNTDPIITALGNRDVENFVNLDPLPDKRRATTDIRALVDAGKVILFCPEARDGHRVAGKALKAKFFEAVFSRDNLARPIAYVCDEAQRFITQDAESGEQNFLDRCRAYRAICILASQSLASIEHELGSGNAARSAMDIISANTPSKFVMRTTDTRTIDWLRTILPSPDTHGPHVVDVRRPSQLRVGEAYSIFADGGWGLHRARLGGLT